MSLKLEVRTYIFDTTNYRKTFKKKQQQQQISESNLLWFSLRTSCKGKPGRCLHIYDWNISVKDERSFSKGITRGET